MYITASYALHPNKYWGLGQIKIRFHHLSSVWSTKTKYNKNKPGNYIDPCYLHRNVYTYIFKFQNINGNLIKYGATQMYTRRMGPLRLSLVTSTSFPSASIRVDSFEAFLGRGNNTFPTPDIFSLCVLQTTATTYLFQTSTTQPHHPLNVRREFHYIGWCAIYRTVAILRRPDCLW